MTTPLSVGVTFDPQYALDVRLAADISCAPSPIGTVSASSGGLSCVMRSGTTDPNSTCSVLFPAGTTVTLTAYPGNQTVLTGWSGDCTGSSTTCQVLLDRDRTVTTTFSQLIQ